MRKRAKRSATLLLALGVAALVVWWLGSGGQTLSRSTIDRPDDFSGPQIHFIYAVPSGAADNRRDIDRTLAISVVLVFSWFHQQLGSPRLAVDTYKGAPDITFVRLPKAKATYERLGADAIAADVSRVLRPRARKLYAVYYDGTLLPKLSDVCGIARGGPSAFAIAFIGQTCFSTDDFRSADSGTYNRLVFVMAHEIVHELGYVPNCAPHSTGGGHVRDSSIDLMYPVITDGVPILDVNNDDYYRAHVAGCPDLSKSPYLHGPPSLDHIHH